MTYDRETNQIVMQDSRVWIAGLGDEGGGGAWLAAMMKELVEPNKEELDKLLQFVDGVLWGGLQYKDGPKSIRRAQESVLLSARSDAGRTTIAAISIGLPGPVGTRSIRNEWTVLTTIRTWPRRTGCSTAWRATITGLVTNHPWDWYLQHAYETSVAMTKYAGDYAVFGQMEGTIFLQIMADLRREGMNTQADELEAKMRTRAERWKSRSVSVRQRNALGLDRPGRGLCLDEIFRLSGQGRSDAQCHPRLRSDHSALGIQRQRPPLLGFYFRRQGQAAGTPAPSLRLRPERHSGAGGISRASR